MAKTKNIVGKKYYRIQYEFVDAAELPEDAQFGGKLFLKGDYVVKYGNGTQAPMSRSKFLKNFKQVLNADMIYDTVQKNQRIIKL